MAAPRHITDPDRPYPRAKVLATLVGVMIAAAVAALLLVTVGDDGASPGRNDQAAATTTESVSVAAPAGTPTTAVRPPVAVRSKARPVTRSSPRESRPASKPPTQAAARKPLTYTVKRGDNLSVIAAWFHQHGYGGLYERNKAVIGSDPDLIFPGQKITISGGGMAVGG